jgi:hypothetical protein
MTTLMATSITAAVTPPKMTPTNPRFDLLVRPAYFLSDKTREPGKWFNASGK